MTPYRRALLAEMLGTALLLYVIVGAGAAAAPLVDDVVGLVASALAVGAGLGALIAFLAPASGAHFNPAVTLGMALSDEMDRRHQLGYVAAQLVGAITGVVVANATFGEAWIAVSATARTGLGAATSELVVTFVLVLLIVGLVRSDRSAMVPAAVGAWIAAAIIASASSGFANPAVTISRMFTDTTAGISPGSTPGFLIAQIAAALLAALAARHLFPVQSHHRSTDDATRLERAP